MGYSASKNSVVFVPPSRSGSTYLKAHISNSELLKKKSSLSIKSSENHSSNKTFDLTSNVLSYEEASKLQANTIEEMWSIVKKTSDREAIIVEPLKSRKGWRTIRIFVSSTFKDFHQEREVLVKEVFPDLRLWCEQRKLRLVECDLRWGVPKDSTTEETIKICLSELDRCYEDNVAPFFLNLVGERAGWIPKFEDVSLNLATQYGWVYGLSVTEMEIVHGAIRKLNPNALFLLREPGSLVGIPDDIKKDFQDTSELCVEKLKALKNVIIDTFEETHIYKYQVNGKYSDGVVEFEGLSGNSPFSQTVFDFFQKRIEVLYPLDPSPKDPLQVQKEEHEIENYLQHDNSRSPLLVIGTAGAGKSAVMAKCASNAVQMTDKNEILVPVGFTKWKIFYHFVGATHGSTDLAFFLQRLTKEVKPDLKETVSNIETLMQLTNSLLTNPNTEPIILFIDAVNQLDEDKQQFLSRWLPDCLSPTVRVVVSMIEGTPSHQMLRSFNPSPIEVVCGPLDMESRKEIVSSLLAVYNKKLHSTELETLCQKKGSSNPLWLTLACEELRVFGTFELLKDKIISLPDDLINLETEVFTRFESETGGVLMRATLCLLEVSRHGLLETELLALLGNSSNIQYTEYIEGKENEVLDTPVENILSVMPLEITKVEHLADIFSNNKKDTCDVKEIEDGINNNKTQIRRQKGKQVNFLPARDWAIIYRNLKPLLRPCGDLGEGRLDFYHRSLSKAVRKKYFQGSEGFTKHVYNYWHGVLANYFENVDDMDRKAEELPYHLEKLSDTNRLVQCLLEWPLFNRLYDEEFSIDLLRFWQKAGGYSVAAMMYKESLELLKDQQNNLTCLGDQLEKVAIFLVQAGQYKEAILILEERVELEENQLGLRPDELADVYQMIAKCKSEQVKNVAYIMMAQLNDHKEVVEMCHKSQMFRKMLEPSDEQKFKLAVNYVLMCHHLSIIADLMNDNSYRLEAFNIIDQAIEVFTEINDIGHIAEAIMTKSFINPREPKYYKEKKEQLMKSLDLCLKAYGETHMLYTRLCLNIGIFYEDNKQLNEAYDYFVKWDNVTTKVLGLNHPKSIRCKETLAEPAYVAIREERERQAAGMA
ncbi:TPR repeat-containing protein DDB_G0287407-like isoform X2 [Hydra vulgaris]|uniref:TPR repeat-containing protein DDB_G0287407-like isoform X2 n=1 Tax=Hydra vulgaris TaxID=6087 RepID=A0ABM4BWJ2_HYDVU